MVMALSTPFDRPDAPVLSEQDRTRIAEAVAAAELRTAGEIVVVIETEPCEETEATRALVAAGFLAIASAGPLSLLGPSLHVIVIAQAVIFACLAALASSSRVRGALRIDRLPSAAAHDAAERAFAELGLDRTRARTGVLLHVALADRRVEVIADEGVHAAVAPQSWNEAVDAMVSAAREGRLADGIVAAVERCGAALAEILPPQPGLNNELSDEPVVR